MNITDRLKKLRLVPVVSLPSVEAAEKLGQILVDNGLPVVEITFRTAHGPGGLSLIKEKFPEMELIAGTVLTPEQVDIAVDAGASAIVSPGFSPKLATYCAEKNQIFMPGVCTATEIQTAMEYGCRALKFFPAEDMGGTKMLKFFGTFYQDVTFMPTGGINVDNLGKYLELKNVICCGGTWLCPEDMMAAGQWQEIGDRVKAAVNLLGDLKND